MDDPVQRYTFDNQTTCQMGEGKATEKMDKLLKNERATLGKGLKKDGKQTCKAGLQ